MRYKTRDNLIFDVAKMTYSEQGSFFYLLGEYHRAKSWQEFKKATQPEVMLHECTESRRHEALCIIHHDLLINKIIKDGRMRGELSEMLIPDEEL